MYEFNEPNPTDRHQPSRLLSNSAFSTQRGTRARLSADTSTWSIGQAGRAFATAALTGLVALVLAAALLTHGTVAAETWALTAGLLLLVGVAVVQVVVRRRVLVTLTQHHLELGLGEVEARKRARSTLDVWLG